MVRYVHTFRIISTCEYSQFLTNSYPKRVGLFTMFSITMLIGKHVPTYLRFEKSLDHAQIRIYDPRTEGEFLSTVL